MKRIIFLLITICCLPLASCSGSLTGKIEKSLAEVRQVIFVGETDTIKATFMCGKREKDYVINGYNTPLIDFGIITITLKKDVDITNARAVLTADTNRYEEALEQNPFDNTLVCDFGLITDLDSLSVKIYLGSKVHSINLNQISSDWKTDYNDALKIACKSLKGELKKQTNGEFKGETYVKIIEDTKVNKGEYYWYVSFACRNGTKHSVIIDPATGEILTKS